MLSNRAATFTSIFVVLFFLLTFKRLRCDILRDAIEIRRTEPVTRSVRIRGAFSEHYVQGRMGRRRGRCTLGSRGFRGSWGAWGTIRSGLLIPTRGFRSRCGAARGRWEHTRVVVHARHYICEALSPQYFLWSGVVWLKQLKILFYCIFYCKNYTWGAQVCDNGL